MNRYDDPVARRAELLTRVGERLAPGELLRDAVWCTRLPGRRTAGEVLRAELHPGRLAEDVAWGAVGVSGGTGPDVDWYQRARGGVLGGPPESAAGSLDALLPEVSTAQVLAVTDRRLLVLRRTAGPPAVPPADRPAPGSGGLLGRLAGAFEQARDGWRGPRPGGPLSALEVCWQRSRPDLSRVDALPERAAGRVVLLFADGSWIVLGTATGGHAERFAAACRP